MKTGNVSYTNVTMKTVKKCEKRKYLELIHMEKNLKYLTC